MRVPAQVSHCTTGKVNDHCEAKQRARPNGIKSISDWIEEWKIVPRAARKSGKYEPRVQYSLQSSDIPGGFEAGCFDVPLVHDTGELLAHNFSGDNVTSGVTFGRSFHEDLQI